MSVLAPNPMREVAVLGAHCDDIAIGAGGTLLALCSARPDIRVDVVVLTGAGTHREVEEHAALSALCPGARLKITVLDLPDGRVPAHWERAKEAVEELSRAGTPDLVLAPSAHDAHQDHRTLAELVPTAFRDHLVLGYEIVKWDTDLAQPRVFQPLSDDLMERKITALLRHYPSQRTRDWYDAETFRALARLRGVQCRSRYAEAFHADKVTIDLGSA